MSEQVVILTVHYINGTVQRFEIKVEADRPDQANLASRLHKFFTAQQMMLELEDRLLVIPMANVLNFSIAPVPAKLPDGVIHNVHLLKG